MHSLVNLQFLVRICNLHDLDLPRHHASRSCAVEGLDSEQKARSTCNWRMIFLDDEIEILKRLTWIRQIPSGWTAECDLVVATLDFRLWRLSLLITCFFFPKGLSVGRHYMLFPIGLSVGRFTLWTVWRWFLVCVLFSCCIGGKTLIKRWFLV